MNVTKISLAGCQIFHLKYTNFNFGSAPDSAGEFTALPIHLAGFGENDKEQRRREEREEAEGRRARGKGRGRGRVEGVEERRGKGREGKSSRKGICSIKLRGHPYK